MTRVEIHRPDPEHIEVRVDGKVVTTANHDEEGWAGMDAVVRTTISVATALGFGVKET